MKKILLLPVISSMFLWSVLAYANFNSGSTGADGEFSPSSNIQVTLPSSGILNYTTVNIPAGVTVTFLGNAANTPVYMLAQGTVNIAGTINLNGKNATTVTPGIGGPGGFNGGYGGATNYPGGKGLGPGGGNPGQVNANGGSGGGFGTNGTAYYSIPGGVAYGNPQLMPLIGGSGGGGGGGKSSGLGGGGGGGGGAIVIASSVSINFTGSITANGGTGAAGVWDNTGGSGSGGAIKLVADTITGNGSLQAKGGAYGNGVGGAGRIRIEATTNGVSVGTDPPFTYGLPGSIIASSQPSLTITSIGGYTPPASPTGNYNQPDMLLPGTTQNPVTVNISASNIPTDTIVTIRAIPQYDAERSATTTLNGTQQSSTGSASVNLSTTYSNVITAEATFTIVAMNYNGEEIDKVHVATTLGGKSETTYITKSGKIIKAELVALSN